MAPGRLHPAAEEFEGVDLGDVRRDVRLISLADAAARRCDSSFPLIAGSDGALEGTYRFLSNPHFDPEDILEPHGAKAAARAAQLEEVVVVHDTTEFKLPHCDPKEVGYLNTGAPGFFGHVSLAVSADGQRRPLGVVGLQTLFRMQRSRRPGGWRSRGAASGSETAKWEDRESRRWQDGIEQSEALLNATPNRIHVADRESDSYELMARVVDMGARFVFRMRHDRRARSGDTPEGPWSKMSALVATAEACLDREVPVSRRTPPTAPRSARRYARRDQRVARLRFAAAPVELKVPAYLAVRTTRRNLAVNFVHVYEVDAPAGEEAVDWILVTTEAVETPAEIARVVDLYRTRWVVEELFQALKSGCIYEQRRLESRHALLNALALFLPIACHLLWLRSRARHAPDTPATEVASRTQILVLREFAARSISEKPTVREVLLAIAGMGGHLMNNGEPGWATLRRGYEQLLILERGWRRNGRTSK